jgi:hypothetical protein
MNRNNQIEFKVIKLRETVKIGELSLIELDPNYLEKNNATAQVYQDVAGLNIFTEVNVRGDLQKQVLFIPYSGIRYIRYK